MSFQPNDQFFSEKSDALLKEHQQNLISLTKKIKEEIDRYENEMFQLNNEIKKARLRFQDTKEFTMIPRDPKTDEMIYTVEFIRDQIMNYRFTYEIILNDQLNVMIDLPFTLKENEKWKIPKITFYREYLK